MKKLLLVAALGAIAGTASADLKINGVNQQTATMYRSAVINYNLAGATAQQNVSANAGNVTVTSSGSNEQNTMLNRSIATNVAYFDRAYQNISSNAGDVTVKGKNKSETDASYSLISNMALYAPAYQNVSSNNGSVTINGSNAQQTILLGSTVANVAEDAVARQNLASNDSCGGGACNNRR
jgi:hypothetical protein